MRTTICTPVEYSLPTELLSYNDFSIVPFLLYRAAPTKYTTLSFDLENVLNPEQRCNLFNQLIGQGATNFIYGPHLNEHITQIEALGLADQNLLPDCDKGFFWTRVQMNSDTESKAKAFNYLIGHLRNSFAHGRTAKESGYLILEDSHSRSVETPNLSARIVLSPSTLVEWVNAIQKAIHDFV